jgi:hypothetical protein
MTKWERLIICARAGRGLRGAGGIEPGGIEPGASIRGSAPQMKASRSLSSSAFGLAPTIVFTTMPPL